MKINEQTTLKEVKEYCAKRTSEFNKLRKTVHCSEGCIVYDCNICWFNEVEPCDWYLEDEVDK